MTTLAQQYTARWRPIIEPIANKYGINADYILSQMAQESLWGTKTPPGSNNYAGIQDFRRSSNGVMAKDAGRLRKFRSFDSNEDFAEYYINMLSRLYPGTVGAKSVEDYASALQDGKRRYAEASNYKAALSSIYNTHYANGKGGSSSVAGQPNPTPTASSNVYQSAGSLPPPWIDGTSQDKQATVRKDVDPYADLWNLSSKTPYTSKANQRIAKINDGVTGYKRNPYKFIWGLGDE